MKIKRILIASLSLLLLAAGASAEVIPFDLEIGYRFTSIDGNEDMYRSQINEDEGFLIRSFTMNSGGHGLFEHLRIDVTELGAGPAGALRVEGGNNAYRFNLRYRRADHFSALPRFANPFAEQGVIPGQHIIDRRRDMFDFDLEFLPGRRITPFVGYSRNQYDGPGQTTYTLGGDDFRLAQDLDETEDEFRVGAGFNLGRFYGQVTQGWRDFNTSETLTLATGAGAGNNPGSVLGRPITATQITRTNQIDGDAPFTNAFVVFQPVTRIKVIANYSRTSLDGEGPESETAVGSFVGFGIGSFFDRFTETVVSNPDNELTRYGARAEIGLTRNFEIVASYRTEDRELGGTALITTIFNNAVTFGGVNRGTITDIINAESSLNRQDDVFDIGLQGRAFGPLSFRLAWVRTDQDIDYSPDLEEIVVPGGQSGRYDRSVDGLDASVNFAQSGVMFGVAYRTENADNPIFRTDFLDRDRLRLRAGYRTPNDFLRVGLTAENVNSTNNQQDIRFDGDFRQFAGNVEVAPLRMLRVRASYSLFDAETSILFRRPESLVIDTSRHLEDGRGIEGGFSLSFARFLLDADYGTFENRGSLPFDFDRYRARVAYDFAANLGLAAEWLRDEYDENAFPLANFSADRFGIFLRWRR
jgi:hypothetical protein